MPFAFVSDNLSFPFQSQGLINLVLNWKFCLSTAFIELNCLSTPRPRPWQLQRLVRVTLLLRMWPFLLIPYHGRKDGRHRRRPHTTSSWSLLYQVLILIIKVESLHVSHFHKGPTSSCHLEVQISAQESWKGTSVQTTALCHLNLCVAVAN